MNAEVMQTPQLSISRLLLLGASSVILCISFFMSVFAPFPLALAFILYGRTKGVLVGVAGLAITFFVAHAFYGSFALFGFYLGVFLIGVGIAEIVRRNISPVKGLVGLGLGFILMVATSLMLLLNLVNVTLKDFIIQSFEKSSADFSQIKEGLKLNGDNDSIALLNLLENPELLVKEVLENFPSFFFISVFVVLWLNMFLVLKSRRLLLSGNDYPYSEKNLLSFKVPFGFVPVLCIGFVLAVWGTEFGSATYEVIGYSIIKCLGVFYFFQGFGVYSDLLNFLGIFGFFRTVIVIITMFMANYLIAAAGLFDNWFDFRKYFVKRKTED